MLAADKDLADWSAEQFFGTEPKRPKDWEKGRFVHEGETLEYYEFVRKRLAKGHFRYDPVEETRSMVRVLCEDLRYRVMRSMLQSRPASSAAAAQTGCPIISTAPAATGRSLHAVARRAASTAFKELRDEVTRFLELAAAGSDRLAYGGRDLRRRSASSVYAEASACSISYMRSNGTQQAASFADVTRRLPQLSFDPHHCVERGGARATPAKCRPAPRRDKTDWYAAQQRLRNQIDRIYDVRMGFSLADLRRKAPGSGVDEVPGFDVLKLLGGVAANEQANRSE